MEKIFNDDEIYTPMEVAKKLKITKEAVYNYIKKGYLRAFKLGKYWRIKGKDLNEFLEMNENFYR